MIATIIIVGIALGWLAYETDWFTVHLLIGESESEYDKRIIGAMLEEAVKEDRAYQDWLDHLYDLKPAHGYRQPKYSPMSAQDRLYANANRIDNLAHFSHPQVERKIEWT